MATDGRLEAAIDTSTLLNFLRIGRAELLAAHPMYHFVVVAQVQAEQKGQAASLQAAFASGQLLRDGPSGATDIRELAIFAALPEVVLGAGERAAIAAASVRGLALAMDDKDAWKLGGVHCAGVTREGTQSIMVALIRAGVLEVEEADAIKADWKANHRFHIKGLASFADLLA